MYVIYTETHQQHYPPLELAAGGKQIPSYENPDRAHHILSTLQATGWAKIRPPKDFGLAPILAVHAPDYVDYLQNAFRLWFESIELAGQTPHHHALFSDTFPHRQARRRPHSIQGQAGYYSFDLFCPIGPETYVAALDAAHCALTGASLLQAGEVAVFALCRPPGHHAGRDFAGGYCYLNNAAIAAQYLAQQSKVAILDIDYHAGNGTQDIFYRSSDVLTLSLHADPAWEYPYFMGYADEQGEAEGYGFHHNILLPNGADDVTYLNVLKTALPLIQSFDPQYLVLSFGADTGQADPLGSFNLTAEGFRAIGTLISNLQRPTLIVMEGGYKIDTLGMNTCALLSAFRRF